MINQYFDVYALRRVRCAGLRHCIHTGSIVLIDMLHYCYTCNHNFLGCIVITYITMAQYYNAS